MTSVSARPHLLTLPREVRNIIYEHLTREIELRSVSQIGGVRIAVSLINAPHINLLLTHPQLHDEYKESSAFVNLRVYILHRDMSLKNYRVLIDYYTAAEHVPAAFRHIKVATVRYIHRERHMATEEVSTLLTKLVKDMPQLHTLRLSQETKFQSSARPHLPFSSISATSHTLSLVQLATCTRQAFTIRDGTEKTGEGNVATGKEWILQFCRVLVSVYSSRSLHANSWVPEEIEALNWTRPPRLQERFFAQLPPETLKAARRKRKRTVDWKEEDCELYRSHMETSERG